jgi:hypothetical protein
MTIISIGCGEKNSEIGLLKTEIENLKSQLNSHEANIEDTIHELIYRNEVKYGYA